MALTREKKKQMLTELEDLLARSKSAVLADFTGVKVTKIQELRKRFRENKITLRVVKNTLLKKALDKNNLKIDENILNKPLAVAFDEHDEVNPAKILFEKKVEMETMNIMGGIVNKEFFSQEQIETLAKMPSREQLQAQIIYTIKSPLTGIVNVLAGNLRGLVSVLKQYQEQKSK